MEWVELPGKGRNTSMLLQELEKRFARLLVLDRTVVDTSKVLFIKSVDPLDREKVGLLLETDRRLTDDWAVVKGFCSRFDKRAECKDAGSSSGLSTSGGLRCMWCDGVDHIQKDCADSAVRNNVVYLWNG